MLRYTAPLILFGAAAYVWYYNATHIGSSVMLLPYLDRVPALEGDIIKQASWSWRILAGLGGIVLLVTIGIDFTLKRGETEEQP